MSQGLRTQILKSLDDHQQTGVNSYVDDVILTRLTGASLNDVRRAMDILEEQGGITCANTFDSQSARITARGMLMLEEFDGA